jgi:hypothetical protein
MRISPVKKTIIAAALVLSLAIVACDDGGAATEAPAAEPVATDAAEATEAPVVEATEAPVEEVTEAPAEEAAESPAG